MIMFSIIIAVLILIIIALLFSRIIIIALERSRKKTLARQIINNNIYDRYSRYDQSKYPDEDGRYNHRHIDPRQFK